MLTNLAGNVQIDYSGKLEQYTDIHLSSPSNAYAFFKDIHSSSPSNACAFFEFYLYPSNYAEQGILI